MKRFKDAVPAARYRARQGPLRAAAMLSIDLPSLRPARRMPLLLAACAALRPGDTLEIVDDRDPTPRYFGLDRAQPGAFAWRYLQCGPDRWQVHITRRNATPA